MSTIIYFIRWKINDHSKFDSIVLLRCRIISIGRHHTIKMSSMNSQFAANIEQWKRIFGVCVRNYPVEFERVDEKAISGKLDHFTGACSDQRVRAWAVPSNSEMVKIDSRPEENDAAAATSNTAAVDDAMTQRRIPMPVAVHCWKFEISKKKKIINSNRILFETNLYIPYMRIEIDFPNRRRSGGNPRK